MNDVNKIVAAILTVAATKEDKSGTTGPGYVQKYREILAELEDPKPR